jgi:hypothetical protein
MLIYPMPDICPDLWREIRAARKCTFLSRVSIISSLSYYEATKWRVNSQHNLSQAPLKVVIRINVIVFEDHTRKELLS